MTGWWACVDQDLRGGAVQRDPRVHGCKVGTRIARQSAMTRLTNVCGVLAGATGPPYARLGLSPRSPQRVCCNICSWVKNSTQWTVCKLAHFGSLGSCEWLERNRCRISMEREDMAAAEAAILRLLDSTAVADQTSGLERILELMKRGADGHDGASRVTNFANYLRQPLASSDAVVATLAADCLGQLARAEGGHAAVKPTLDQALRRLREGNRLDSAVLVLVQLAEHAPTLTYGVCSHSHPPIGLESVLPPLTFTACM